MNTFKNVMDWTYRQNVRQHVLTQGNDRNIRTPRTRSTAIIDICNYIPPVYFSFHAHGLNWLPDNKLVQVYVRSFRQALFSLLTNPCLVKEDNFSFPLTDTPFLPADFKLDEKVPITELHHGRWWTHSWKTICSEKDKILVPIIFYMDGISLDVNSNLNLTPLNMTIGILNTETRRQANAWETIYFHPDKIKSVASTTGGDNVTNLHTGLQLALKSFKDICEQRECISWDGLPYASKKWSVKMKFAIAFVIGDTQLHDQLCCRYATRNAGVKKLCRHCKCDTVDIANPANRDHEHKLWKPINFVIDEKNVNREDAAKFKAMSHHRIHNAFHNLEFGSNKNNIHMATPGECLLMHQLGVAKQTVETFRIAIGSYNNLFESIARKLGGAVSRQSDRCFPRTRFGTNGNVLKTTMKEGKDYAGMLLCILLGLLSFDGRASLKNVDIQLEGQVRFIELVLGMEEFLKHGSTTLSEMSSLKKMMRFFLRQINDHCHRNNGMRNRLIKNHLYLHLPEYVNRWGPPAGWDSAPVSYTHLTLPTILLV